MHAFNENMASSPSSIFLTLLSCLSIHSTLGQSTSQACGVSLTPTNSIKPSVASGYTAALIATGLTKPRSIQFDSSGNLLVAQQGAGIEKLSFKDDGGTCLQVQDQKTVVDNRDVGLLLFRRGFICRELTIII